MSDMSDETRDSSASADATAANETDSDETAAQCAKLTSEIEFLREQLKAKEEEARTNYDRFLRQTAELENFKKRLIREKEDASRFANEALVKELLPVVDNLERAVSHTKSGGNEESLVEGMKMILKGLMDALAKHGVVQISAVGQPFDPQLHEAMAQVESTEHKPNTVLEEHQKGYLLKDRLLRPSLVTVVKALKSNGKKNNNGPVENGPADD